MKESPESKKMEEILRRPVFVAGGFLGDDDRHHTEVIETDLTELARLGYSKEQVADRMQEVTDAAVAGLENWVDIEGGLVARVEEAKGGIPCPWQHKVWLPKRVTIVKRPDKELHIQWTDLSIHFIREHGFFEGRGAAYRIEPMDLIAILF